MGIYKNDQSLFYFSILLTATLAGTRQADSHLFIVGRQRHPKSIAGWVFEVDGVAEIEFTPLL